jgi:hypothetical protein
VVGLCDDAQASADRDDDHAVRIAAFTVGAAAL